MILCFIDMAHGRYSRQAETITEEVLHFKEKDIKKQVKARINQYKSTDPIDYITAHLRMRWWQVGLETCLSSARNCQRGNGAESGCL